MSTPEDLDARLLELLDGQPASVIEGVKNSLAKEEAARIIRELRSTGVEMPALWALDEFLEEEDPEETYRIDPIMLMEADVLLVAQKKIGKSTLVANFIRAIVDEEDFLGRLAVTPLSEGKTIVHFDNELGAVNLRRWLREQQIINTHRVHVSDMRGKLGAFDIMNPVVRSEWAERIRAVNGQVIIFDCLRPALDALGMSEDKEASRFAQALTALKIEAGASDLLLIHHAGHDGSRARGDSALSAWCTDEWKMRLKDQADPFSPRIFSAFGRSKGMPSTELEFDALTRRLILKDGAVVALRTDDQIGHILRIVTAKPGITSGELHSEMHASGITNKGQRASAINQAKLGGQIVAKKVGKSSHFYLPESAGVMWSEADRKAIGSWNVDQMDGGNVDQYVDH